MALVSGARGTTTGPTQSIRKVDMAQDILLLEPSSYPLTTFSKAIDKKPAINPEFSWQEDAGETRIASVAGAQTSGDTAIEVTTGQGVRFAQHDSVLNTRTSEIFRVSSVATDTLTVVRGIGGSGVAMNDLDELFIIGSAQPEGDTSKPARSSQTTKVTNYCEIQREPVELTETWRHSEQFVNEDDWTYQLKKAGIEHAKEIELSFLLPQHPNEDTSGSQPRRTTGGALHFASANQADASGQLTEAEFFTALRPIFRYPGSGNRKMGFASMLVVDVLNQFPRAKVQVVEQAKNEYGVTVMRYISPHGTLDVVTHRLLTDSAKYAGYMVILDMGQIKYRYLANRNGSRDTHLRDEIQANDADTRKAEYLTEAGLQFGQALTHGLISGVTSGIQT